VTGVGVQLAGLGGRWQLTVTQEAVEWRTGPMPGYDEQWVFTDGAGHVHRGADLDASLVWVVVRGYWCDMCRDEHEEGEWRCRLCGVRVEPGVVVHPAQQGYMPGLAEARLVGYGYPRPGVTRTYQVAAADVAELLRAGSGELSAEWVERAVAGGVVVEEVVSL